MKTNFPTYFKSSFIHIFLVGSIFLLALTGCIKDNPHPPKLEGNFKVVNLVADVAGYNAARLDPLLVNAWGLAFSAGGTPWLGAQATHVSTVYTPEGLQARAPVLVPGPHGFPDGNPTGVVFNATPDFILDNGARATFLFVGLDGVLSGWNGAAVNAGRRVFNNAAGNVYTGLAIASDAGANFLYASNFRTGKIDVFDKNFAPVSKPFKDPNLPAGYSPFNIQTIGDKLYVMYAKVGPDGRDQAGPGNGIVSIFSTDGAFVKRFTSKGPLNSPWGVALASSGFFMTDVKTGVPGEPAILVGNFGDGRINAFNADGEFLGAVNSEGKPVVIEGLWAISFPPSTATTVDPNRLYFTAGPDEETHGLFGYIIKQ